jgi:GNAT superfamily N-acetyltransferase
MATHAGDSARGSPRQGSTARVEPWQSPCRDALNAFILAIQQGEFGVPITLADQPDLLDVPGFYLRGDGGFWIAREGDEVIGSIALLDHGDRAAALRKMFVRHDRRGAAHGVAAALFSTLLAHAAARGLRVLRLGTRPEMLAAHRFYEKHGFRRIEAAELPASFPRMGVDSVFYRLDLPG